MQPGEAIFLLNYEDICFVMKDWPRPGTSHSPTHTHTYSHSHSPSLGPSPSHRYSPVPSPAFNSTFSLALCNPCSTGNCRHCSCFLFFFLLCFSVVPLLFLLCSLLRICCTVVSCQEDDGGGGGVRFQFGAAGRSSRTESSTLPSSGAYQMHWLRCK